MRAAFKNELMNTPKFGTWSLLTDPAIVELLGLAKFDFCIIDMEHGPHTFSELQNLVRAAEVYGVFPLARVPGVEQSYITRALDSGAYGLMVPNVNSLEQVNKIVEWSYFDPIGVRGHSPFTRSGGYSHRRAQANMVEQNESIFLGILIEGQSGIDALPKILEKHKKRIHLIYIGLYDLAKSVGTPGDITSSEVEGKISEISSTVRSAGVALGLIANTAADAVRYVKDYGAHFICLQNDTGIVRDALEHLITQVRGGLH